MFILLQNYIFTQHDFIRNIAKFKNLLYNILIIVIYKKGAIIMYNYELKIDDYIAFNRYFAYNNSKLCRNRTINRVMGPILLAFIYAINTVTSGFNLSLLIIYIVIGVIMSLYYPTHEKKRLDRQVKIHFLNDNNKSGLGEKQFNFEESTFSQVGKTYTDRIAYDDIKKFEIDKNHFYIFTDEMSAFIIPFSAFSSQADKDGFEQTIRSMIKE